MCEEEGVLHSAELRFGVGCLFLGGCNLIRDSWGMRM